MVQGTWLERHRLKLLGSCLVLLIAGWTVSTPGFQWRAQLISLKARGLRPDDLWTDLLLRASPQERLRLKWNVTDPIVTEKMIGDKPCPVLWETPMGDFWGQEDDIYPLNIVIEEQYVRKIYEKGAVAIHPGDVVFDTGSHLGAFTRFALQHGAGLVVAFDPNPVNNVCYKRTFEQEIEDGKVILVEAAVWEAPGTLDFTTGLHSGAGQVHPAEGSADAQLVTATTIDETVARLHLDRVDFIKMDIEGSERHALRGGRESIARFNPRMAICIYHRPDDPEVIPREVLAARSTYQMENIAEVMYFH